MLKNGLYVPYFMKKWLDFDQTCMDMLLEHEKELFRLKIGGHDPILEVIGGLRMFKNGLFIPYFLKGWLDFDLTC